MGSDLGISKFNPDYAIKHKKITDHLKFGKKPETAETPPPSKPLFDFNDKVEKPENKKLFELA